MRGTVIEGIVSHRNDRRSCVKNEKRELQREPCLLSHPHTAHQSLSKGALLCKCLFWDTTKIIRHRFRRWETIETNTEYLEQTEAFVLPPSSSVVSVFKVQGNIMQFIRSDRELYCAGMLSDDQTLSIFPLNQLCQHSATVIFILIISILWLSINDSWCNTVVIQPTVLMLSLSSEHLLSRRMKNLLAHISMFHVFYLE